MRRQDRDRIFTDLAAFADVIGWPVAPWQGRALALETRTTAIVAPRQSGKSRSLAVLGVWAAFRTPRQRVLIVSAGEEAARRLLAEVRRMVTSAPLLSASVIDEQAGLVTLTNGSEVRSVPASERQIRGWSTDLLLLDEAALLSDDLIEGAAIPTTAARPHARIVMASSALRASGSFYDTVRIGQAGAEHVRAFAWALSDCPWITPSAEAAMRESMSAARAAAELDNQFASGMDAVFTVAAIDRVTTDYVIDPLGALRGPARMTAGCDWGAVCDRSTFVATARLGVPGPPLYAVSCVQRWPPGYAMHKVVEEIATTPGHLAAIAAEETGMGAPLVEALWREMRRRPLTAGGGDRRNVIVDVASVFSPQERVHGRGEPAREEMTAVATARHPRVERPFHTQRIAVRTTAGLKAAVYSAAALMIDREQLLLPASATELRRELLTLRVSFTATGMEHIEASAGGHDDLADALAFSLIPYRPRGESRVRTWLADLAERRTLPEPDLPPGFEGLATVSSPGGHAIPRRPIWMSVAGHELTIPGAATASPTQQQEVVA